VGSDPGLSDAKTPKRLCFSRSGVENQLIINESLRFMLWKQIWPPVGQWSNNEEKSMSDTNGKTNQQRRDLLKFGAVGIIGSVIGARLLGSAPAFADAPLEMIKENDPQASALGYHTDAKKVDAKKWPKRAGADGAKQFCYNCQFFQAAGKDPKSLKAAPCQILSMKGVASKGWCNTWTQNPAVKG
jgi:hypothetical protein